MMFQCRSVDDFYVSKVIDKRQMAYQRLELDDDPAELDYDMEFGKNDKDIATVFDLHYFERKRIDQGKDKGKGSVDRFDQSKCSIIS